VTIHVNNLCRTNGCHVLQNHVVNACLCIFCLYTCFKLYEASRASYYYQADYIMQDSAYYRPQTSGDKFLLLVQTPIQWQQCIHKIHKFPLLQNQMLIIFQQVQRQRAEKVAFFAGKSKFLDPRKHFYFIKPLLIVLVMVTYDQTVDYSVVFLMLSAAILIYYFLEIAERIQKDLSKNPSPPPQTPPPNKKKTVAHKEPKREPKRKKTAKKKNKSLVYTFSFDLEGLRIELLQILFITHQAIFYNVTEIPCNPKSFSNLSKSSCSTLILICVVYIVTIVTIVTSIAILLFTIFVAVLFHTYQHQKQRWNTTRTASRYLSNNSLPYQILHNEEVTPFETSYEPAYPETGTNYPASQNQEVYRHHLLWKTQIKLTVGTAGNQMLCTIVKGGSPSADSPHRHLPLTISPPAYVVYSGSR
uniref:Uncharacterized protein n=1 Tax=Strigamia maritima TaxID=126957 RepID=T1JB79_STRMM